MVDLLPCPFCGGPAEIVDIDEGENAGGSCVCCTRCMASGNVEFEFKENFVANWNRRAADPENASLCARAESAETALAGAREAALREALDAQPSTAENSNEDAYQRRRFGGIMEYARAILVLIPASPAPVDRADGGE